MQIVLVNLQPFRRNSLFKCVSQPEIAKKIFTKTFYFGVQGRSCLSMLMPLKSPLLVLVVINSMSVPMQLFLR